MEATTGHQASERQTQRQRERKRGKDGTPDGVGCNILMGN